MSEFVYKDFIPANARVIIDYSRKHKVGFSYPIKWSYWKAVWKRAYPTIMSYWVMIHFVPFFYVGLYLAVPYVVIKSLFFPSITVYTATEYFDFKHFLLPIICGVFYWMGIPAIITYILARKPERLSKWMPRLGYYAAKLAGGTKETIFKPKDIIDNKCQIPIFSNVYLNYKCNGEFNNYLTKVEILEVPFHYKHKRFFLPFLKKKEKNDYKFRAVFYFSEKPKHGKLDVEFM